VARANQKKRMLTELELRAVYAQINPHFVFNTLSAALYFINRKRFDDAYTHVNKFSRLIRAYLKSSQDRYILLSEEIEMLTNYIDLQRTRFEGKFDFDIQIDNKIPTQNIKIPSLLLQPLVENAINHGLFHKGDKGLLQLKFIQGVSGSELICIIDDNGVGREKAKEIKKSSSARQESYGTKLTQQLIEIFKEYENMPIELEYIDKHAPETGTTVKITIKNIKYVA
jgi:LytS/YehU family sensor histidine kinase